MATATQWLEGARLRTLPAAVSPVVAGSGVAVHGGGFVWWKASLALVVALALQVGVNFANDYSDGLRGTDADRVGPPRLVGSGAASPGTVKAAALTCFGVAAVAGLVLAATTAWWLLLVGAAAIVAAWFYTGGPRPYGYHALGEVSVFVFFGLVAVVGTAYVQTERVSDGAVSAALALGCLACAILVANNLRDIDSDVAAGKRTLAVALGDTQSRGFYAALVATAFGLAVVTGLAVTWWALLAWLAVPLAIRPLRAVRAGARGAALIPVLRDTGLTELVYAAALAAGLLVSAAS